MALDIMQDGGHKDVEKVEDEKYFMEKNATEAAEVERLSYQHEVIKSFMGSLVLAPVDLTIPGLRILDSATADGNTYQEQCIACAAEINVLTSVSRTVAP
jgi:hypothetical protein